jgi:hypothetical protein
MSASNIALPNLPSLAGLAFLLLFCPWAARADSLTNLPSIKAQVRTEGGPGLIPSRCAYLTAGTNRFGFIIPGELRMDMTNPERVALVSADYNCLITVRVVSPASGTLDLSEDGCRQALLAQHPGAKFLNTFSRSVGGQSGPAFDLQWMGVGSGVRRQRVVFIPSAAGVLELSLVTSPDGFGSAEHDFNFVLLTFRAGDAAGKVTLPQLSNKS